ncbi:MAG: sulfurtransferase TusA family protein [Sneathiella sp.]|nr:sulfurtransferase TusA family protein [Sneathiella sp.]
MPVPSLTLDTTGLHCPLPVLKAKKAIKGMKSGEIITVIATDPASYIDFDHFCHAAGHILLEYTEAEGVFTYKIEIAA